MKSEGLSKVRLKYIKMLMNACLDSRVKYGCGVWNKLNGTQEKELNELKTNLVKRVLEVPYSTPSSIVKYEFGLTDLDLDCYVEKIVLASNTTNKKGLGGKLLSEMQKKDVPGFCVELKEFIAALGISDDAEFLMKDGKEIRKEL